MEIIIRSTSAKPIYEQIFLQIKRQILDGTLSAEAELPSIRSLAKDLAVSVITTKKAYEELARSGLVHSRPGKGMFVATIDQTFLQNEARQTYRKKLTALWQEAASSGISYQEFADWVKELEE